MRNSGARNHQVLRLFSSLLVTALATGLATGLAINVWGAAAPKPKKPTYQVDTDVYAGSIQQVDAQKATLLVNGAILQRTTTQRPSAKPAAKGGPGGGAAPKDKEAPKNAGANPTVPGRLFSVNPFCKITPAGVFLRNLKVGQQVEVTFHEVSTNVRTTTYVADKIDPAGTFQAN